MKVEVLHEELLRLWVARVKGWRVIKDGFAAEWFCWNQKGEPALLIKYGFCHDINWSQCGPMVDQFNIELERNDKGAWYAVIREWVGGWRHVAGGEGATPMVAVCRAVVNMAFGDEVPDEA